MVKIIPFKCFYPISLTEYTLPMILSDVDIFSDVRSIDENELLKIPANIHTTDYKRIFQEILTLGHSRKYEALHRYWTSYETLGFFREEKEELFYVYRMEYTLHGRKYQQTGLICLLELDKQSILGHENTIDDKIQDQLKRLDELRTSISPVFLLYNDENQDNSSNTSNNDNLNELINIATYSFPIIDLIATNNVRHTVWKINNPDLANKIKEKFNEQKKIYVADGHHRIESALVLRENLTKANINHTGDELYNFILSAIFPISQAQILEYNRIVKNVKKFKKHIIPKIEKNFIVREINRFEKPTTKGNFIIYAKNKWYKVKPKEKLLKLHRKNIIEQLDSYIIQEYIFKEIFKIKNVRKSHKLAYMPGSKTLEYLIEITEKEEGVAFILPPVKIDDMITIANQKQIVPPKTTWFEPKILKGIMFWKF